jgi:toxin ParE1/3/4
MSSYKLSLNAKEDLRRIYNFGFMEFGEVLADKYFWGFYQTFEKIALNPFAYQSIDHIRKGYRRCVYRADTIYFRVQKNNVVEITAILGGQDIDEWLE